MAAKLKFRASSAHRWLNCPGSARLEHYRGVNETSEHAAEGIRQHSLSAAVLSGVMTLEQLPSDERDLVEYYVNTVWAQVGARGHLWVEQPVEYGGFTGTPDAIVITEYDELQIHDRKFPHGRQVYPERNPQLSCYALGALKTLYPITVWTQQTGQIRFFIHQGTTTREWEVPAGYLDAFATSVRAAIDTASQTDAPRIPHEDTCRYCTAKHVCPELRLIAMTTKNQLIDATKPPRAKDLNEWMNSVELVRQWADAVEKAAYRHLQAGNYLDDWKLVQGRSGNRVWTDESTVEMVGSALGLRKTELYSMTLKSPAQVEKALKKSPDMWEKLTDYVTQKEGRPTLASASDPRPAINYNLNQD